MKTSLVVGVVLLLLIAASLVEEDFAWAVACATFTLPLFLMLAVVTLLQEKERRHARTK